MSELDPSRASTSGGIPVAPSMSPAMEAVRVPHQSSSVDRRVVVVSALAVGVALLAGLVAQVLTSLIGFITNVAFYGRLSTAFVSPAEHQLGPWVMVIPVLGALIVGVMARYGSAAIRGHGIPEAMEQVLHNQSRIPPRMIWLKPVSSAIAIGTGGPFGAEGPIIATGGALGSSIGQWLRGVSGEERKILLAAGAAGGMAATFGSPAAAVLLAVELLLFEYRPRSLIPVALAATVATGVRFAFVGSAPVFPMPELQAPGTGALIFYVGVGAAAGLASIVATRVVYWIEDLFDRLPLHWMWWPAIGAVAVGVVGYFSPRTLGVGYVNIEEALAGHLVGGALLTLCLLKFVSWSVALGSGTSGGTLAPLFTFGAGLGSLLGQLGESLFPTAGIDFRIAALVAMAAIFAGASRALLASVVFAFETTRQPMGLLPLLGGCTVSFLVSSLFMRHSIMTEKLARRGARVPSEYQADPLAQASVRDHMTTSVVTVGATQTLEAARQWLASGAPGTGHQAFPVVDGKGQLVGVIGRQDLLDAGRPGDLRIEEVLRAPLVVTFETDSLREAADHMVREGVGRLPVVRREAPRQLVGMISKRELLSAHRLRVDSMRPAQQKDRAK